MIVYRPRTWAGFVKKIEALREEYAIYERTLSEGRKFQTPVNILYRGQSSSTWSLETTLERNAKRDFSVLAYYRTIGRAVSEIESYSGKDWKFATYPDLEKRIRENQDAFRVELPGRSRPE